MLNRKMLKNMTFDLQAVMFFEKFNLRMTFGGDKSHVICKYSAEHDCGVMRIGFFL
jgi:hypothetical protein